MAKKSNKEEMQRICEQHGVDKLYYNTRGEYFTQPGYALLSEGNDKKKVGTYISESVKEETGKEDKKVTPAVKETKAVKSDNKPAKKDGGDTPKDNVNDNPENKEGDEQNINQ